MATFDELFADHRLTDKEREALVYHLASFRMRRTIETLLRCKTTSSEEKNNAG